MKLSEFMKEQIELVSDKFLLEVSDTKDAESRAVYFYKERNTVWDTVKKISTVAACFMLAIAAVLTFILAGGGRIQGDTTSPADILDTDAMNESSDVTEPVSPDKYGFIMANTDPPTTVWGDYVFFVTENDLIYDIRYESADGEKSIFEGAFDEEGILPGESAIPIFVIDPNTTENNEGVPVFIIAYNVPVIDERGDQTGTFGRVISYDMKTKKTVLLADNIDDGIFGLGMYGSQVFVTGTDFEPGVSMCSTYNLYSISLATGKTVMLDNPAKTRYDLITADEDYVYFGENGTIYKSTYNFENVTEVAKVADEVCISAYEAYFGR